MTVVDAIDKIRNVQETNCPSFNDGIGGTDVQGCLSAGCVPVKPIFGGGQSCLPSDWPTLKSPYANQIYKFLPDCKRHDILDENFRSIGQTNVENCKAEQGCVAVKDTTLGVRMCRKQNEIDRNPTAYTFL